MGFLKAFERFVDTGADVVKLPFRMAADVTDDTRLDHSHECPKCGYDINDWKHHQRKGPSNRITCVFSDD